MHVGDVEVETSRLREQRGRALRIVRVDVDLERRPLADDEHGVAELLERADQSDGVELLAPTAKFVQKR